eukprot:260459-Pelagomonas_calceolata.AAC.1
MPAVSTSFSLAPDAKVTSVSTASRVVPLMSHTITRSSPQIAFSRLLLPARSGWWRIDGGGGILDLHPRSFHSRRTQWVHPHCAHISRTVGAHNRCIPGDFTHIAHNGCIRISHTRGVSQVLPLMSHTMGASAFHTQGCFRIWYTSW